MKDLSSAIMVVAICALLGWALWLAHLEGATPTNAYTARLNEYVQSVAETDRQYCERVLPMSDSTRDLINF